MDRHSYQNHTQPGWLGVACLILFYLFSTSLQAQEVAAKVQFVVGNVSATSDNGKSRQLKKGDRIYAGDTIKSGANGSAQLIYRDRSRMAVRVNTEFQVKEFQYDTNNKKGATSIFSLLSGALRMVSGLIGSINPERVTINTPLATIGIRGTDHEVVHITPAFNRVKKIADVGTYNKVYAGATVMKTAKGNLNLGVRQVGFVGGTKGNILKPVKIRELPKALQLQLINKIPVQAKTLPKKQEPASTTTGGTTTSNITKSTSTGGTTTTTRTLDATTTTKTLDSTIQLAPSTLSTTRDSSLSTTTTLEPSLSTKILEPALKTTIEPSLTLDPSFTTIISPTKTLDPSISTIISPTTTTIAPKTLISPTTTIAPTTIISPTKLIAPTTTISPTTIIAPTKLIAPTTIIAPTKLIAPTTIIAPTTTKTISPTTTIISPTTTTIKQ